MRRKGNWNSLISKSRPAAGGEWDPKKQKPPAVTARRGVPDQLEVPKQKQNLKNKKEK